MNRATGLAAAVALLLAGCASVPHVAPQVNQFQPTQLGLGQGSGQASAAISSDWWTAFNDPQLNQLIGMGLAGNPGLDIAMARVRAAQSTVQVEGAGLLPQVNGTGQISRARIAERLLPSPIGGSTANIGIAAATLSWDLDLFGKQHSAVRQAASSAQAAQLDVDAARLALSVSIAQTYVGLVQANRQIAVADGFVATRQRALGLTQTRIKSQLASQFDLTQAQTLLAEAQQAHTRAVQARDVLVHALAALVGRGVDFYPQIATPTLALDQPPTVPALLPADLLGRRPDLLAGQARIEAAVQGRKVAAAAFLPDVSISALAGLTAVGLDNFFKGSAGSWSSGAAISLPIFEGGRLKAQYRGATADLDMAVASYNQSVVGAVREASDAITNVHAADQDLSDQAQVVQGLRDTVHLDQVRVSTGLGSRLDTIDAGFRLLEAEQSLVDLQANALTRRIQLIAALGGGFDPHTAAQTALSQTSTSDIHHD